MKQPAEQNNTGLQRRIHRLETVRMWLIVAAAALLIGGYVTGFLPVLYACVLPLAAAALITWRLKILERKQNEAMETEQGE